MRIVYMGTPEISSIILKDLINSRHEIIGVVTQPDKPKGRGGKVLCTPVKELALEHNIPVYQPIKLKQEGFIDILKDMNPDIIIVAAFGQILPVSVLEFPKFGCVNVHASLLPRYRGAAPIQWSIINGEEKTGITIMHMDAGIDTGDMIMREEVIIDKKETAGTLHHKLAVCGGQLLLKALDSIEDGSAPRQKQDDSNATYVKVLTKEFGHIDFSNEAIEIERLVRGLNPWPSAYGFLEGKTLKIWDADVVEEELSGEIGEIVGLTKDSILVKTGKGLLAIKELQLEGKKRMSCDAFLRGYHIEVGTKIS